MGSNDDILNAFQNKVTSIATDLVGPPTNIINQSSSVSMVVDKVIDADHSTLSSQNSHMFQTSRNHKRVDKPLSHGNEQGSTVCRTLSKNNYISEINKAVDSELEGKKVVYKHIPHSQKPAPLVAQRNARERKRVEAVNYAFLRLRKHVPYEPRHKRLSKVKTLHVAISYISGLQELIRDYDRQTASTMATPYQRFRNYRPNNFNRGLSKYFSTPSRMSSGFGQCSTYQRCNFTANWVNSNSIGNRHNIPMVNYQTEVTLPESKTEIQYDSTNGSIDNQRSTKQIGVAEFSVLRSIFSVQQSLSYMQTFATSTPISTELYVNSMVKGM